MDEQRREELGRRGSEKTKEEVRKVRKNMRDIGEIFVSEILTLVFCALYVYLLK